MHRIGLLGGTFDPPHLGHLVLAEAARVQFALDRVLLVPAGDPYHRRPGSGFEVAGPRTDLSPAADRLAMTALAIDRNDALVVDGREVHRRGPTYTVDTLEELTAEAPAGTQFFLLLGADSAAELHRWRAPERLATLATILVAPRGDRPAYATPEGVVAEEIDMPRIDITSTLVRQRARAGRSIRYLVPDAVAEYIGGHSLYRPRSAHA